MEKDEPALPPPGWMVTVQLYVVSLASSAPSGRLMNVVWLVRSSLRVQLRPAASPPLRVVSSVTVSAKLVVATPRTPSGALTANENVGSGRSIASGVRV